MPHIKWVSSCYQWTEWAISDITGKSGKDQLDVIPGGGQVWCGDPEGSGSLVNKTTPGQDKLKPGSLTTSPLPPYVP